MTAQEKAKELYDKFHYQICNDCGLSESDSTEFAAKFCANIAVDEMLSILFQHHEIDYWKQVKEEINKI